ncbi:MULTISPECIES: PIN domain-containing protein [unclassified Wenzhouxiangella]|uniref:PIN domain-containing protein n=1 Tax=unclassified Wenzhouxiangella TaxID=2613841 RepID=UPI000E327924|nr:MULTISPECIES: PIN domain-containing protein [unclassified Wenzhouxiangella]RFF27806.1 type II toxin-antitoxin system VapC family toxin [Wenzhouxiangella sp. 15181]RFP70351.1 type II toxin-antitoxin system VapC family toxin [Wenzhouxiangella sp. 15190]
MAVYLLDTNMLIAAVKGRSPVRERLETIDASNILISPIVLGELLTGVEKSQRKSANRKRLLTVLEGLRIVELGPEVAVRYGQVRAFLESKGTPIGANDFWIAAHALDLGAVLVTDNEREFHRVPGLDVENWLAN